MKSLLYYPSFEVYNETWLKFALLYMDELMPIVPFDGERYLSDQFKEIKDSTDLIKFYRPRYETGYAATLDAIDTCESILNHPFAFKDLFKYDNVLDAWRTTSSHQYTIFRDKYVDAWEHFVIQNKFGTPTNEGIAVSRHLGLIYMTLLSQAISAAEEIPSITDRTELDRFSIFCSQTSPATPKSVNVANYVINLLVPANLSDINFRKIIKLRNKRGYKKRLSAFQSEIEKCIKSFEAGKAATSEIAKRFLALRGSFWKDYSDEILTIGIGSVPAALGIWIAIDSKNFDAYNYLKEMSAATALTISSIVTIRNSWNHTKVKRYTRRYIADIRKIDSDL